MVAISCCEVYDHHQATTMNHMPTQCTIIFILLLIIPIVTGACKCKYSIYIVQFPTPPPNGVEECTQCCHSQLGSSIRRAGGLWDR